MRCSLAARMALTAALLLPTVAYADPKDDARRHFAAGLAAAQAGDFEIALQRFLAAQEAFPHPATLYNIAKAYQDLDDIGNALIYYRLFRDAAPDKATEVDPLVAVLEARASAPSSPVTGPTRGGGEVVVDGATEEERARLSVITMELQALRDAIRARTGQDVPVEVGPSDDDPSAPPTPDLPAVPTGGFLTGAYERIVVTASRVGQDPLDSPSTITVISSDDIRLSGATTLPDVLRRVVGVDAMSLSSGHTDVSIRGFNRKISNKVLVLIDGRSTYIDFAGATFWNTQAIALEEIDRIEVIRGPGSAVYGANAVTGVINIITKTPGEEAVTLGKVEGGSTGYARGVAYTSGRSGRAAYRLSAGYHQMGRWAKEFPEERTDAVDPFLDDLDLGLRALKANARIDTAFGTKGFASLSGGVSETQYEYYNIGALPNFGMDASTSYLRGDLAWGNLHLRSFWNMESGVTGPWYESVGQGRTLDAPYDNDAVDLELEGPVSFDTGLVHHTLNLGVGYRYKRIAFGYLQGDGVFNEHHLSAFVNEQATLGKLGVVASLRMDRHPLIADLTQTLSPRAALIYRLFDKTSLRATAGTAFRAPNSIESYMDFALNNPAADGVYIRDVGGSDVIGTTPLQPERIQTFEVGVHDESSYLHTADVVVYMNRVRNLIGLDALTSEAGAYDPQQNGFLAGQTGWINLVETYTGTGVEADLELYPTDGLDLVANVNLAHVTESNPETGETVADRSQSTVKANFGAAYRTPYRTDLSLMAHVVGPQVWRIRGFAADGSIALLERPVDARLMLSGRIGVRPFPNEALEVAASVWNLTGWIGTPVLEHPEGQPVGGIAYGSVSYTF